MPNTPEADLQVENETVEPYRGIIIFRTLQRGVIVGPGGERSKRSFPPQTFYATLEDEQLPKGYDGEHIFVAMDVEGVRSLLDQAVPGAPALIVARQQDTAKAAAKK